MIERKKRGLKNRDKLNGNKRQTELNAYPLMPPNTNGIGTGATLVANTPTRFR